MTLGIKILAVPPSSCKQQKNLRLLQKLPLFFIMIFHWRSSTNYSSGRWCLPPGVNGPEWTGMCGLPFSSSLEDVEREGRERGRGRTGVERGNRWKGGR